MDYELSSTERNGVMTEHSLRAAIQVSGGKPYHYPFCLRPVK